MKKILCLLSIFLITFSQASYASYARTGFLEVREATSNDLEIAVGTTDTIRSKSFSLNYGASFCIMYKATTTGVANVQIDIEQGVIEEDRGESVPWYVIPENKIAVDTVTDQNWHMIGYSPVVSSHGRFKFTGQSGNTAGTTMQMRVIKLEDSN